MNYWRKYSISMIILYDVQMGCVCNLLLLRGMFNGRTEGCYSPPVFPVSKKNLSG